MNTILCKCPKTLSSIYFTYNNKHKVKGLFINISIVLIINYFLYYCRE